MSNQEIVRRIREFCELSSSYVHETGQFIKDDSSCTGPKITKKFEDWNIKTYDDWDRLMNIETIWLFQHKKDVLKNIKYVKAEGWSASCKSIEIMLSAKR